MVDCRRKSPAATLFSMGLIRLSPSGPFKWSGLEFITQLTNESQVVSSDTTPQTLIEANVGPTTAPSLRILPLISSQVSGTVVDDNAQLQLEVSATLLSAPVWVLAAIYELEVAVNGVNLVITGNISVGQPFIPDVISAVRLSALRSQGSGTLTWPANLTVLDLWETGQS